MPSAGPQRGMVMIWSREEQTDLRNNLKEKSAEFGDLFHKRDEEEGGVKNFLV